MALLVGTVYSILPCTLLRKFQLLGKRGIFGKNYEMFNLSKHGLPNEHYVQCCR